MAVQLRPTVLLCVFGGAWQWQIVKNVGMVYKWIKQWIKDSSMFMPGSAQQAQGLHLLYKAA